MPTTSVPGVIRPRSAGAALDSPVASLEAAPDSLDAALDSLLVPASLVAALVAAALVAAALVVSAVSESLPQAESSRATAAAPATVSATAQSRSRPRSGAHIRVLPSGGRSVIEPTGWNRRADPDTAGLCGVRHRPPRRVARCGGCAGHERLSRSARAAGGPTSSRSAGRRDRWRRQRSRRSPRPPCRRRTAGMSSTTRFWVTRTTSSRPITVKVEVSLTMPMNMLPMFGRAILKACGNDDGDEDPTAAQAEGLTGLLVARRDGAAAPSGRSRRGTRCTARTAR